MFGKKGTEIPEQKLQSLQYNLHYYTECLQSAERQVHIKQKSLTTGKPAEYYPNNWSSGFSILDKPIEFYEQERDKYAAQKLEVETQIAKLESKIGEQLLSPDQLSNRPGP